MNMEMENPASGKGQAEAQATCGYGPITLRRDGDFAVVEIEFKGKHIVIIREHLDADFSHCIQPVGIVELIDHARQGFYA